MGFKDLDTIDGLTSINNLVHEHNDLIKEWNDLTGPLDDAQTKMKKAGGLDKCKGAQLCHILKGFPCAVWVSIPEPTAEKLKACIKIDLNNVKKPIQVDKKITTCVDLCEGLEEYIDGLSNAVEQSKTILEKVPDIMTKAGEVLTETQDEAKDMEPLE